MTKGTRFTAEYETAVFKQAINGWRSETVYATLEAVSDKMAVVVDCFLERATSNRQYFSTNGIAIRETGKKKRIGCLSNIKVLA